VRAKPNARTATVRDRRVTIWRKRRSAIARLRLNPTPVPKGPKAMLPEPNAVMVVVVVDHALGDFPRLHVAREHAEGEGNIVRHCVVSLGIQCSGKRTSRKVEGLSFCCALKREDVEGEL
jgi:hypothetical protein